MASNWIDLFHPRGFPAAGRDPAPVPFLRSTGIQSERDLNRNIVERSATEGALDGKKGDAVPLKHRATEGGPRDRSESERVLKAWTALEVLSPQALPDSEALHAARRKEVQLSEDPAPWHNSINRQQPPERSVYWFAYLGQIEIRVATRSLLSRFADDNAGEKVAAKGKTTMALVVLNSNGAPVPGKTFVSSFPWGYGCVRRDTFRAIAEFSEAEERLRSKIEERLIKYTTEGEIRPTTKEELEEVTRWLIEELGLPDDEVNVSGVVTRVPIRRQTVDAPDPELLNSFFIDDLIRVREALTTDDVGLALSRYLLMSDSPVRQDVVRDAALLRDTVSPKRLPLSRWPGPGRHSLALMQQLAVNHAVQELKVRGLVGINGPPGTGKTTLLRDVIAQVVLHRAVALSKFAVADDAFQFAGNISLGPSTGQLYHLHASLLGHEIVVASSNNKAVENVSGELPNVQAIAKDLDPPLRYFSSISDCVAARGIDAEIQDGETWGLAAAVLGNAANKTAFANAFWWHQKRGLGPYIRSVVDGWNPEGTGDQAPPLVLLLEKAPLTGAECRNRWDAARAEFKHSLKAVRGLITELAHSEEALRQRSEAVKLLETSLDESARLYLKSTHATQQLEDGAAWMEDARTEMRDVRADRDALMLLRPGLIARLFRTRRYRAWRDEAEGNIKRVSRALEEASAAARRHKEIKTEVDAYTVAFDEAREAGQAARKKLDELDKVVAAARAIAGKQFPDEAFWALDDRKLQQMSPWLGTQLQDARDRLFCASFGLHRAFVDVAAPYLRYNLSVAMALLKGQSFSAEQEPVRRSIWATLFLVVPVLSTTFASVARLFGRLGREQIGWLLIDEAGQAVPQAAIGAIWRAARVVSIGDPLQIEPVVTIPSRLQAAIFNEFQLDPQLWAAPAVSVQALCDRTSWLGTLLRRVEGDMWVGSTLRVHRRCENPMFSISNQIAYGGMMVYATQSKESEIGRILGDSRWISVDGTADGKWSEDEGDTALEALTKLLQAGIAEPDIFFISPFRTVANRLREKILAAPQVVSHFQNRRWKWVAERVGTIHTFQGKEAEAVVLVLGASNPESVEARNWAGNPANLLNVAVSRHDLRACNQATRYCDVDPGYANSAGDAVRWLVRCGWRLAPGHLQDPAYDAPRFGPCEHLGRRKQNRCLESVA